MQSFMNRELKRVRQVIGRIKEHRRSYLAWYSKVYDVGTYYFHFHVIKQWLKVFK